VGVDREKIVIYFDKPESWRGVLDLPAGFGEMDYDTQNDIIQGVVEEFGLRPATIDYWDYSD
jgi:hypothetical protein